ncbi:MAG: hypothetical protein LBC72_01890 [Spirochaetaceae bacterium]|jgi:hypothetical protein|nr:hypothetical protein [Spirochaetaceae bacterium]
MDERIKSIRNLNEERARIRQTVQSLHATLGKTALERLREGQAATTPPALQSIIKEYDKILIQREDAGTHIARIEGEISRLTQLESAVLAGRRQLAKCRKDALPVYAQVGEAALAAGVELPPSASVYKSRCAVLAAAIHRGQEREDTARSDAARSDAARSDAGRHGGGVAGFLAARWHKLRENVLARRAKTELNELYTRCGTAVCAARAEGSLAEDTLSDALRDSVQRAAAAHSEIAELEQTLDAHKKEIEAITGTFRHEGGGAEKLRTLKNQRQLLDADCEKLRVSAGVQIAAAENRPMYDAILFTQDIDAINAIAEENSRKVDVDDKIQKLEASLEIDGKQTRIEKLEKQAESKRLHIFKLEAEIADIEQKILLINKEIISLGEEH